MRTQLILLLCATGCAAADASDEHQPPAPAQTVEQTASEPETIEARTKDMQALPGFLALYWDADEARLFFEVTRADQEILYYVSLPSGLGSNDVGLDRGQLGPRRLVVFRQVGGKVLLYAPNLSWRSTAADPIERAGVYDSFASSVLWGFPIEARTIEGTRERVLVDGTDFFLRDAHGIARKLADAGQGAFRLEESRSAIDEGRTRSFPSNSEIEAYLTFSSDKPGPEVRATAADAGSVTFRVRHSFVALPKLADHPYDARKFDPRCGFFANSWHDASVPIDEPLEQRVISRHRLTAGEPIVYYVDRAAPEPIRTALLEGARYWTPVFAAAGYPEGFRVELLPEWADPQDARYNVIQWVNRSTRGWSYGMTVSDPRTGEILKGHVTLGALRVRQDVLLFEGLLSPYTSLFSDKTDARVTAAALARIRQLSAHEVGHTLGLAHNFAASVNDRASVMDYPAPLVRLGADGELDLSDAYAPGCGPWDELVIRYGYGDFDADEAGGLAAVLDEMQRLGLFYMSDGDARGTSRAHPLASLWDNGTDAVTALTETIAVRRKALDRLSTNALKSGRAQFELERALVPLYFHHRYQLEAAVRAVGGVEYEYAVVGDSRTELRPVSADRQRRALAAALESLEPGFLALPSELVAQLVPPPPGYRRDREAFDPGSFFFDPLGAARSSVSLTFDSLMDAERARRLVDQAQADPGQLSWRETLDAIVKELWNQPPGSLRTELQDLFLERCLDVVDDPRTTERVRELTWMRVSSFTAGELTAWQHEKLRRYAADPDARKRASRPRVPPGSPIGMSCGYAPEPRF